MSQPGIPASSLPEEEIVDHLLGLVNRDDAVADLVRAPMVAVKQQLRDDLLGNIQTALEAAEALQNDFETSAPAQIALINAAGDNQVARVIGVMPDGIYASTADALSNGVAGFAALAGGSGGTNGTFNIAFSGGGGSGASGRFTVAGGALVSIVITQAGKNYTSAPSMSFSASSGLTGASATAVIAQNEPEGAFFTVAPGAADGALYDIYRNISGAVRLRVGLRHDDHRSTALTQQILRHVALGQHARAAATHDTDIMQPCMLGDNLMYAERM